MNLIELNRALRLLDSAASPPCSKPVSTKPKPKPWPPLTTPPAWSPTNLLIAPIACWSAGPSRPSFATHKGASINFDFNKKMNRSLIFDLATGAFIARHEDALFLGPPGTGKSHLAQAIGQAAIQQGYRVLYREAHKLLDDLAEATIDGTRKEQMELLASVPLLIIDDLGMRKLPVTAAGELLEIIMRRYERTSTLLTSNRLCGAPHNLFNAKSGLCRVRTPIRPSSIR
jgi:hypothetical protein